MKITLKIDKQSQAETRRLLAEFEQLTGKGVEQGIEEIAMSVGRRLAHTVQPYGLSQAKGDKLEQNIAKQAHRAIRNANLLGIPGGAETVHRKARDGRGRVPKGLPTQGQYKRKPISPPDRHRTVEAQMQKAGRAKAAWVEATNRIGKSTMTGVGGWIMRHVGKGYGNARKIGRGLRFQVELENRTSYIRKIQRNSAVQSAIKTGFKNGYTRIQRIIDAELKKLKQ